MSSEIKRLLWAGATLDPESLDHCTKIKNLLVISSDLSKKAGTFDH